MVTLYGRWTERLQQIQHVLFMVSGVFYYFNSILNPILYTILSKRFRRSFADISGKCWVYQMFAKVVSRKSKEESSLDQELAEFNLVINVAERPAAARKKHFMSKERRQLILERWEDGGTCLKMIRRAKKSYDKMSVSLDHQSHPPAHSEGGGRILVLVPVAT